MLATFTSKPVLSLMPYTSATQQKLPRGRWQCKVHSLLWNNKLRIAIPNHLKQQGKSEAAMYTNASCLKYASAHMLLTSPGPGFVAAAAELELASQRSLQRTVAAPPTAAAPPALTSLYFNCRFSQTYHTCTNVTDFWHLS